MAAKTRAGRGRARAGGRTIVAWLMVAAGPATTAGCRTVETEEHSDTFIAFARDFAGFDSWTSYDIGAVDDDGVAVVGTRRAYLNRIPPSGSAAFPVGTILVKTIAADTPTPGQTFAMVKRGGPYNVQGAIGWEWFELTNDGAADPVIRWRGITPPAGGTYADCPDVVGGACNDCHQMASDNDFVPSTMLALSQF